MTGLDILLDFEPPLESYSDFETEGPSGSTLARRFARFVDTAPRAKWGVRSLMEVLGFIRGKQAHGHKRVFQHRDYTILDAAATITQCLVQGVLTLL